MHDKAGEAMGRTVLHVLHLFRPRPASAAHSTHGVLQAVTLVASGGATSPRNAEDCLPALLKVKARLAHCQGTRCLDSASVGK